eukprot:m.40874 g.40874  ORF g.40874 m.40874 type:complete len:81 (+) comp12787_c0_seq2:875-1117(+)
MVTAAVPAPSTATIKIPSYIFSYHDGIERTAPCMSSVDVTRLACKTTGINGPKSKLRASSLTLTAASTAMPLAIFNSASN